MHYGLGTLKLLQSAACYIWKKDSILRSFEIVKKVKLIMTDNRVEMKSIDIKYYSGFCPVSKITGEIMKRRKCKTFKSDGTEEQIKTCELKCALYEEKNCCRFIRKIEENCMKVFDPCIHRNTMILKKRTFLHYQRSDNDWNLKRIRKAEETFVPCTKCNPVR